jgi:hypothetical protein
MRNFLLPTIATSSGTVECYSTDHRRNTQLASRFVVMKTRARPLMSEDVVCLTEVRRSRRDWSKEEIAYLERAAHFVRKLGVSVETDHGVTDEGEPWFVICDASSDEVLVHFCRIRRRYVACAPFLESSLSGHVFAELIERLLDRHAAAAALPASTNDDILPMHVYQTLLRGPRQTAMDQAECSRWRIEDVAPHSPRCEDAKQELSITPLRSKCVGGRRSQSGCE